MHGRERRYGCISARGVRATQLRHPNALLWRLAYGELDRAVLALETGALGGIQSSYDALVATAGVHAIGQVTSGAEAERTDAIRGVEL